MLVTPQRRTKCSTEPFFRQNRQFIIDLAPTALCQNVPHRRPAQYFTGFFRLRSPRNRRRIPVSASYIPASQALRHFTIVLASLLRKNRISALDKTFHLCNSFTHGEKTYADNKTLDDISRKAEQSRRYCRHACDTRAARRYLYEQGGLGIYGKARSGRIYVR